MQPIQNTSIHSPEYRDLAIEQLVESPTNPRKRYQQASLEELAQSFRSRGVLEPLLVRPVEPERFEIVAGSRRYRAARITELPTVPARVREMTDAEALEVQLHRKPSEGRYSSARRGPGLSGAAGSAGPTIHNRSYWGTRRKECRLHRRSIEIDGTDSRCCRCVSGGPDHSRTRTADREAACCPTAGSVQSGVQVHLDGQRPDGDAGACQRVNSLDRL